MAVINTTPARSRRRREIRSMVPDDTLVIGDVTVHFLGRGKGGRINLLIQAPEEAFIRNDTYFQADAPISDEDTAGGAD